MVGGANVLDAASCLFSTSRKCCARSSMSVPRSRNGGMAIGNTFRRWYRSSRSLPSATAPSGLRLVAASTLTSALIGVVVPTRVKLPVGAGEGAFLVAEELALDQLRRHRAAVERQEGRLLPPAEIVDGLRGE